jgi:hypothetical protein
MNREAALRAFLLTCASFARLASAQDHHILEEYEVKASDTLSDILYSKGIGNHYPRVSTSRLYGRGGWLEININKNSQIKSWNRLPIGTRIILVLPPVKVEPALEPVSELPQNELGTPVGEPAQPEVIESTSIEPKPAESQGRLLEDLAKKVPRVYLGVRYAWSLSSDPLLTKLRQWGVLLEVREGLVSGLRVYADIIPKVSSKNGDFDNSLGWRRLVLGRAFEWAPGYGVDRLHLIPKIGTYSLTASLPRRTLNGDSISENFDVRNALSLGGEVDAEFVILESLMRVWFGQDFSTSRLDAGGKRSVNSKTFGLMTFVGGYSTNVIEKSMSVHPMFFIYNEQIDIEGTDPSLLGPADYQISLSAPYAGAGVAVKW